MVRSACLLMFVLAACGDDSASGVVDSGMARDALDMGDTDEGVFDGASPPLDSSAAMDAAPDVLDAPDAEADAMTDAGSTDPRFCPLGEADGCCPLAVRYGGSDPDCEAFACSSLTRLGEPIVLDPIVEGSTSEEQLGTAALAFDGVELAIAWTDTKRESGGATRDNVPYYFERRNTSGELVGPIYEGVVGVAGSQLTRGTARLEYDVDEGGYAFTFTNDNRTLASVTLDDGGSVLAFGSGGQICGGSSAIFDLFDSPEGHVLAANSSSCTGASSLVFRNLDRELNAGIGLSWTLHEEVGGPVGFYDRARARFAWVTSEGARRRLVYRTLPLSELPLEGPAEDLPSTQFGSRDAAAPFSWAFDGNRFMVVSESRAFLSGRMRFSSRLTAIDAETGEVIAGEGGLLATSSERRLLHARIQWLGAGYMVALTTVMAASNGTGPVERDAPRTELRYLDASGATLQTWSLSDLDALYPDIAWVGDRVAVSWVQRRADRRRFHVLDFFDCAEDE